MKIGKRSLWQFKERALDLNSYASILRFFQVHEYSVKAIVNEVFSRGKYPCTISIKTPLGSQKVNLFSVADFSTLNLIFCRQDYYVPKQLSTIIDIGSNIGLSTLYWLTRNHESFVYCYEPSPISLERLNENLSSFSNRYSVTQAAVSDYTGSGILGLEETGVCSSLDLKSEKSVECEVIHINEILESAISKHDRIDVLKIDSEGHEVRTLKAIDKSFYPHISVINVEYCQAQQYIPKDLNYQYSFKSFAERFVREP
ncbi:MAG: FkbM family methyltransferase [Microcystis aeruginosa L211-07]|nr:FkbM family methyltransferase [Microcystis aeruginosa L211-07]